MRYETLSQKTQLDVQLALTDNSHKASREVAADTLICQSPVFEYLEINRLQSFKIHLVQELNEDYERSLNDGKLILNCIVFSDEPVSSEMLLG